MWQICQWLIAQRWMLNVHVEYVRIWTCPIDKFFDTGFSTGVPRVRCTKNFQNQITMSRLMDFLLFDIFRLTLLFFRSFQVTLQGGSPEQEETEDRSRNWKFINFLLNSVIKYVNMWNEYFSSAMYLDPHHFTPYVANVLSCSRLLYK